LLGGCGTVLQNHASGALTTLSIAFARSNLHDGYYPDGESRPSDPMGTSTGQHYAAGAVAGLNCDSSTSSGGTVFKIAQAARSRRSTAFAPKAVARTELSPAGWSKPPMRTCTGQPCLAGPTTMARSSKSPKRRADDAASFDGFGQGLDGERPYAGLIQAPTGTSMGRRTRAGQATAGQSSACRWV